MRRREFITQLCAVVALPIPAQGQQNAKVRTVGFLYPGIAAAGPPRIAAFLSGLRTRGLREPEDVQVVARITGGDATLLVPMADDLAKRKVDLILAISPAAIRAVRSTTETIPIVAGDLESDPVDAGFIASFARPGGNITGTFLDFPEFGKKWLEILREAVPHVRSVGVFWDPATGVVQLRAIEAAAHTLKLKLETMEVHGPTDLEKSVLSAKQRGVDALLFLSSPFIGATQNYLRT